MALAHASAVIISSGIRCREYRDYFVRRRAQPTAAGGLPATAAELTWTVSASHAEQLAPGAGTWRLLPSVTPVAAIGKVSGTRALIIMALSLVNANTFNAYTGAFQVLAFGSMWRRFTLGGADVSWLAGWFAAAVVYLLLVASTASHGRHFAVTTGSTRPAGQ